MAVSKKRTKTTKVNKKRQLQTDKYQAANSGMEQVKQALRDIGDYRRADRVSFKNPSGATVADLQYYKSMSQLALAEVDEDGQFKFNSVPQPENIDELPIVYPFEWETNGYAGSEDKRYKHPLERHVYLDTEIILNKGWVRIPDGTQPESLSRQGGAIIFRKGSASVFPWIDMDDYQVIDGYHIVNLLTCLWVDAARADCWAFQPVLGGKNTVHKTPEIDFAWSFVEDMYGAELMF